MTDSPPYDQLFIYEVSGDARPALGSGLAEFLGLWLEGDTSFIFFSSPADEQVAGILARGPGLRLLASHHLTYEQWQGGLAMEPLELEGLAVAPAWREYHAPPGRLVLRLDPGLVFGNGLHPTTRHCLELLLLRAQREPLGRVLDLGCGTGILGLAALLLGAEDVLAVDLNPLCVSTTRRNAELNGLPLAVEEGPARAYLERPANLVMANVHWQVQQELWERDQPLNGKEDLILSGVMRSQRGLLEGLLATRGFKVRERREAENTWFTIWACRSQKD